MYQTVRHLIGAGVSPRRLWWLRMDHPLLMQVPLGDLCEHVLYESGSSQEDKVYLFLDELTYADKWDLWLKTFYDERWPIRIVATSSSTAALRDRGVESGIGRWEEQYLAPYLFSEFLDLFGIGVEIPVGETFAETITNCIKERIDVFTLQDQRRRFLLTGGVPELLQAAKGGNRDEDEATLLLRSQRTLRNDAVERAVYKDIPQAFGIDSLMLLERLLYTLAGQIGGILSPQGICQDLGGMSQPTFSKYLSYLERTFLVFTLENYSGNETSVQKRGRKLYFVDAAVRNAALQRGIAPLHDHKEMEILIENMVAGHLHALSTESQVCLYYWRDRRKDEIDFVYDHPEQPLAFEISMSGSHHRRGITAFAANFPRFDKRCYLVSPNSPSIAPERDSDGIGSLPLDLFLLAAGAQSDAELKKRLIQ